MTRYILNLGLLRCEMISFGALNELSEMKFLALEFFRNADQVCSVESGVFDEERIPL